MANARRCLFVIFALCIMIQQATVRNQTLHVRKESPTTKLEVSGMICRETEQNRAKFEENTEYPTAA